MSSLIFPEIVQDASLHYSPHIIARHALELSQKFNEYYHSSHILKEEETLRDARLLLISCIKQVLKNGMKLLKIDVLERM